MSDSEYLHSPINNNAIYDFYSVWCPSILQILSSLITATVTCRIINKKIDSEIMLQDIIDYKM